MRNLSVVCFSAVILISASTNGQIPRGYTSVHGDAAAPAVNPQAGPAQTPKGRPNQKGYSSLSLGGGCDPPPYAAFDLWRGYCREGSSSSSKSKCHKWTNCASGRGKAPVQHHQKGASHCGKSKHGFFGHGGCKSCGGKKGCDSCGGAESWIEGGTILPEEMPEKTPEESEGDSVIDPLTPPEPSPVRFNEAMRYPSTMLRRLVPVSVN